MSNQPEEAIPLKSHGGKTPEIVATPYEFSYMRKPKKKSFSQMIYDREKGKFCGRTPKNWGEIILFYAIFYAALAAFCAVCFKGLMYTIDENVPRWKLGESLIGTNPGLGFRPVADNVDQGSLIWFDSTDRKQIKYWVNRVDEFLEKYKKPADNQKNCDFDSLPKKGQVCKLDVEKFGKCSREFDYGYNNSAPCIFLKLNRIFDWVPEYFNDTAELPSDMPDDLRAHIEGLKVEERNQVWVSCRGEDGSDAENLKPEHIEYYPTRGFPSYFYPYTNVKNYVSPLVAVKFLRVRENRIVNIECRAWAKNIQYSGSNRDRKGSVHFELMIDMEHPDAWHTEKPGNRSSA